MKRFLWAGLPVLLAVTVLGAEDPTKLYSDPQPPSTEVLDRLNLKKEWATYVPMDGRKDGFVTIQLIDSQMFVQTRSGLVVCLDPETGRLLWKTAFGKPYQAAYPLAVNTYSVIALNGGTIYSLDRDNGAVKWKMREPEGLTAPPVVDEVQMYLSAGSGRVYSYFLPVPAKDKSAKPAAAATGADKTDASGGEAYPPPSKDRDLAPRDPQPTFSWDSQTLVRLEFRPLMGYEGLMLVTPTGTIVGLSKYPFNSVVSELYRFRLEGEIHVPAAYYEDVHKNGLSEETAYIGCSDAHVYAIGIANGKQRWRFTVGSSVIRQPVITADDVFVTAEGNGMFRLSRATGEPQWRIRRGDRRMEANPDADRFVAANAKFVYAADKTGRLLVLDRGLGTELSRYDVHDFPFPVLNSMNDRIYLAANNGLIVCLHDKEYVKPYMHLKLNAGSMGRSVDERIRLAKENLARKVTHPGIPDSMPLKEAIEKLRKTYQVQIFSSDRAFTLADPPLAPVNDKLVFIPKVEGVPLSELLNKVLGQVGATYELYSDVVQVIPLKAGPAPDKPKPPDKDKPPADKPPDKDK